MNTKNNKKVTDKNNKTNNDKSKIINSKFNKNNNYNRSINSKEYRTATVRPVIPQSIDANELSRHYTGNTSTVYPKYNNADVTGNKQVNRTKLILIIVFSVTIGILVLGAIGVIIAYGIVPCSFTTCHSRASKCINKVFYAQCICDYPYAGNGKTLCDDCGLTNNAPNVKVVGGVEAVSNSWPSAVLIAQSYTGDYEFYGITLTVSVTITCGGTLINHQTILTASHCITSSFDYTYQSKTYKLIIQPNSYYPSWQSMFKVYVGLHDKSFLNTGSDPSPGIEMSVAAVIKHESYDDVNFLNDIAILKLTAPVSLTSTVQLACLPTNTSTYPAENINAWIVGWGTNSSGSTVSATKLRNAKITVYNSSMCSSVLTTYTKNWDSQICAGEYAGGKDTCQGDSGGSLFTQGTSQRYVASGIVSYGDGCALPKKPGIYTRTSYYLDWIIKNYDF